jgi:hypothetical protein
LSFTLGSPWKIISTSARFTKTTGGPFNGTHRNKG